MPKLHRLPAALAALLVLAGGLAAAAAERSSPPADGPTPLLLAAAAKGATTTTKGRTAKVASTTTTTRAPSTTSTTAATTTSTAAPPTTAAPTTTTTAAPPVSSSTAGRPFWGVLQPQPDHLDRLRAAGVTTLAVSLSWKRYEPAQGSFDAAYAQSVRDTVATYRAKGFQVILSLGLQYPPTWVFGLSPSTRFVNQHGDTWVGGTGEDVANAVYEPLVRAAQQRYLERLGRDLAGQSFTGIRVGGLLDSELRYPPPAFNGRTNSYWAFDPAAQASSPVPGWKPGDPGVDQARAFLERYLQALTDYQVWLVRTVTANLQGPPHVLYPSWGVRPGEVDLAVDGRLSGASRGERRQTINMGLDWARQVAALPAGAVAWSTWMDTPDQGTDHVYESPVRYLAWLARQRGVAAGGENTGTDDAVAMYRSADRVVELGLVGMLWMSSPELFSGSWATVADYERTISDHTLKATTSG